MPHSNTISIFMDAHRKFSVGEPPHKDKKGPPHEEKVGENLCKMAPT